MTPFEYTLVLVTIIISLAIADMLASLNRLLRARRKVLWDWRTLAAALLVLLTVLQFWWGFYRLGQFELWSRYGVFLLLMLQLILMFLLACAALPDDASEGLNLATYYENNRRYFWTLFALVAVSAALANFIATRQTAPPSVLLLKALINIFYVAVMLSLARVRRTAYHSWMICFLLLVMALGWFPLRLE